MFGPVRRTSFPQPAQRYAASPSYSWAFDASILIISFLHLAAVGYRPTRLPARAGLGKWLLRQGIPPDGAK